MKTGRVTKKNVNRLFLSIIRKSINKYNKSFPMKKHLTEILLPTWIKVYVFGQSHGLRHAGVDEMSVRFALLVLHCVPHCFFHPEICSFNFLRQWCRSGFRSALIWVREKFKQGVLNIQQSLSLTSLYFCRKLYFSSLNLKSS